jgi:hypothetical protein
MTEQPGIGAEHPLLETLKEKNMEEIQGTISELNKKLSFASQTGNTDLVNQLQLVLNSYHEAYRLKLAETNKKGNADKFTNKIDIN